LTFVQILESTTDCEHENNSAHRTVTCLGLGRCNEWQQRSKYVQRVLIVPCWLLKWRKKIR